MVLGWTAAAETALGCYTNLVRTLKRSCSVLRDGLYCTDMAREGLWVCARRCPELSSRVVLPGAEGAGGQGQAGAGMLSGLPAQQRRKARY